jgi:integrative and conjugative element protein (TIGR02256 family)
VSQPEEPLVLAQGQQLAVDQLTETADRSDGAVEVLGSPRRAGTGQSVVIDIALDCSGIVSSPDGVKLRIREAFSVEVSPQFPFTVPQVSVPHVRWAGVPHVQWQRVICLYAAPPVEWLPADGMRGLLDRLIAWLRRAAAGDLDPEGQPLHPPVAYFSLSAGVAVIRPDLPEAAPEQAAEPAGSARMMIAVCRQDRLDRVDVIDWVTPEEWRMRFQAAELSGDVGDDGRRVLGAGVIILSRDIGFEYPAEASALLAGLEAAGADRPSVLGLLGSAATVNGRLDAVRVLGAYEQEARPLCLFVGTPSRRMPGSGQRRIHLVCWRIDQAGQQLLAAARSPGTSDQDLAEATAAWLDQAATTWMPVMEARPEVTIRRDSGTSAAWLAGKRVLVLGAGALGAPAAEICVRADAAEVTIADNGIVAPGVLVRQPYRDAEIGQHKAAVLAGRLNQIHADDRVGALPQDIIVTVLTEELDAAQFDLIIDATANAAVASRLEYCLARSPGDWPPVMTMLLGHQARRGVVAVAKPGASGAGRHVLRKLGLAASVDPAGQLADVRGDFFPDPLRTQLFQPEPGCSDPTFTGSAAETGALAAHLMTAGLDALVGCAGSGAAHLLAVGVVRLGHQTDGSGGGGVSWLGWPNDLVLQDGAAAYEVRFSAAAVRELRAESARSARVRGRDIETGGMLLGEIDEACRCIWIDMATGPPPDSRLSGLHFDHGTEGTEELIEHYRTSSGQLTTFVGMWHTHPDHQAQPSPTDETGVRQLLIPAMRTAPRAIMVILGGQPPIWSAWLDRGEIPDISAELVRYDPASPAQAPAVSADRDYSAWPGGFMAPGHLPAQIPVSASWPARLRAWIWQLRHIGAAQAP